MIVYKEEAYKIMGAAFKVYNGLGHGFLEAVLIRDHIIEYYYRPEAERCRACYFAYKVVL